MKNNLELFVQTLLKISSEKELLNFFTGILTERELEEIPRRLQIIRMLKKGVTQHEIAKQLNVGVATVTRGSKELQKGHFKNI